VSANGALHATIAEARTALEATPGNDPGDGLHPS
jgi:hypothetical protein